MGATQSGQAIRAEVCNPQAGDEWGERLADVLQPPAAALQLGYVSPMQFEKRWDAAQQLKGCIMKWLSGTSNGGRFNLKF